MTNQTNQDKLNEIDARIARTADPIATDRLYKERDKLIGHRWTLEQAKLAVEEKA